ncbi:MAG: CASP C terminal-domain-containing protein [Monoraphidium minutum]|nr:MAG: CASP C terminal-domain-containing protein [Monoraphidium minutum]
MDLFKQLESAIHTTAAQVVEGNLLAAEFPVARAASGAPRAPLSAAATAAVATGAAEGWAYFGLDGRKGPLRRAVERLQQQGAGGSAGKAALDEVLAATAALLALPDPCHALEGAAASTKRAADLESEVRQLQRDLKAAGADDAEVQALVADHEREKAAGARMRAELEALQAEVVSLKAAAGSSLDHEAQLRSKAEELEQLQAVVVRLRGEYESSQTQLFDALARQEAAGGQHPGAADDVAALDELDRLRRQVAALSAQREELQRRAEALTAEQAAWQRSRGGEEQGGAGPAAGEGQEQGSGTGAGDEAPGHGLLSPRSSMLGAARDAERQQVRAELEGALSRLREAEHQARLLESRVAIAEAQAERLAAEVARRPLPEQHAEATAAVAALSALLGKQLEQEGWESGAAQAAVAAVAADSGQLHGQLQERVRKMADALAAAGRASDAARGERDAAARDAERARGELSEARAMVQQLEEDLAVAASLGGGDGAAGGALRSSSSALPPDLAAAVLTESALAAAGAEPRSDAASVTSGDGGGGGPGGDASAPLLAVVVRQRDRLAGRISALEDECGRLRARADEAAAGSTKLSSDNVELVKQIRYLKARTLSAPLGGVGGGGGGGEPRATVIRVDSAGVATQEAKAARYSCGPVAFELAGRRRRGPAAHGPDLAPADAGGAEARYAPAYERAVNPFADFQRAEAEGRVRALKLHDRALLAAGGLIVGSPAARGALAAYLAALHGFVMLLIYTRASPHCPAT